METNYMFYLVAFIGVISHFMVDFQKARNASIVFDFKKNIVMTGIYLFFAMVLVMFKQELTPALNILGSNTSESFLTWWAIGFSSDSIFKGFIGAETAKLKIQEVQEVQK